MSHPKFVPLPDRVVPAPAEMQERAVDLLAEMQTRRTIRQFSEQPIPDGVLERCLEIAGTAPSGANLQPWQFVVVRDAATKKKIRMAAEEEERAFYRERAPAEWLEALAPLGTDEVKPYLETAPALVAVFGRRWGVLPNGKRMKHYYVDESVGLATGFLISALHQVGLASLTHTPSPMGFLSQVLERPENERPFLLLVVGYPADDARVPDIGRKPLGEIATFMG